MQRVKHIEYIKYLIHYVNFVSNTLNLLDISTLLIYTLFYMPNSFPFPFLEKMKEYKYSYVHYRIQYVFGNWLKR